MRDFGLLHVVFWNFKKAMLRKHYWQNNFLSNSDLLAGSERPQFEKQISQQQKAAEEKRMEVYSLYIAK